MDGPYKGTARVYLYGIREERHRLQIELNTPKQTRGRTMKQLRLTKEKNYKTNQIFTTEYKNWSNIKTHEQTLDRQ